MFYRSIKVMNVFVLQFPPQSLYYVLISVFSHCFIRYILYKTPKSQEKQLTGVDYVYIYPDNNNKAKSRVNKKPINAADGILANTLRQLLDFNKDKPVSIILETQPPDSILPF